MAPTARLILKLGGILSTLSSIPPRVYEVRPRKERLGFDLISDALPFGRLWYSGQNATSNAIAYAKFYSGQRGQVKVHNAVPPLRKDKRLS